MVLSSLRSGDKPSKRPHQLPVYRGCQPGSPQWRRMVASAVVAALKSKFGASRAYKCRRQFCRASWEEMVKFYSSDKEFQQYYRLPKAVFDALLERLRPRIERDAMKQENVSGEAFGPELMLAMTLRWLAGGMWQDIVWVFGRDNCPACSKSCFYKAAWRVIDALLAEYYDEMLCFEELNDEEALQDIQAGFDALTNNTVVGCIGAVDGMAVRIRGPKASECTNPATYFNRKHFFSVNLQAMCDSQRRFRWASIKCAGSSHDATAWGASGFDMVAKALQKLDLWIAGDDAYPLSEYLITPFPGKGLDSYQDNFNFFQSRLRITIECAFGELNRRCQCDYC